MLLGAWPTQRLSGLFLLQLKPQSSIFPRELSAFLKGLPPPLKAHHTAAAPFSPGFWSNDLLKEVVLWPEPRVCDWWPLRECPNEAETSLSQERNESMSLAFQVVKWGGSGGWGWGALGINYHEMKNKSSGVKLSKKRSQAMDTDRTSWNLSKNS